MRDVDELLELTVPFYRRARDVAVDDQVADELLTPTTFKRTVDTRAEVVARFYHRGDVELGRRSRGQVRLVILPDRLVALVLVDSVRHRGFIDVLRHPGVFGASFTFRVSPRGYRLRRDPDGRLVRELLDVDLEEISPVGYAAYPGTTARLLSLDERELVAQRDRERRLRELEERERRLRGPGVPLSIRRRQLEAMTQRLRLRAA